MRSVIHFTTLLSSTAEVITELIKVADLCLILAAAFACYLLYHVVNNASLAGGLGRYVLPSLFVGSLLSQPWHI